MKIYTDFFSLIEMTLAGGETTSAKVFLISSSEMSEGMNLTKMFELKVLVRFCEMGLIFSPANSFSLLLTNWLTIKNYPLPSIFLFIASRALSAFSGVLKHTYPCSLPWPLSSLGMETDSSSPNSRNMADSCSSVVPLGKFLTKRLLNLD